MLKPFLILMALFSLSLKGVCQNFEDQSPEQLKWEISRSKQDTNRVKLLLALSKALILKSGSEKRDLDTAFMLIDRAEKLSVNLKDIKGKGHCMLIAALLANKKGETDKGLSLSLKALSLFTSINDLKDEANSYIMIGQHYEDAGDQLKQKVFYYEKALNIFLQLNARERAAATLVDLADLQMLQSRFQDALRNLQKALLIYQKVGYKDLQGLYSLLCYNYIVSNDSKNALKYGLLSEKAAEERKDTSLQLCTIYYRIAAAYSNCLKYREALYYSKKAYTIAQKYNDEGSIDATERAIIETLYRLNRYREALLNLKTVSKLSIYQRLENRIELWGLFIHVYLKLKDYKMAKIYADKINSSPVNDLAPLIQQDAIEVILHYYTETQEYVRCYSYLNKYYTNAKQRKSWFAASMAQLFWFKTDSGLHRYADAIKHYQLYKAYDDSAFNKQKSDQTSLLEIQFETEKKNHAIQLQSKNIEILKKQSLLRQAQLLQARVSRNWIIAGALMLLSLLGLVYSRYRLKQRNNKQLELKQFEIQRQNKLLENLLLEKDWLLKEVHHRVKNNLQIVMSLLNTQSAYLKNLDALEAIRESQNRVQTISLIHQKLYSGSNVASIDMPVYVADLINYLSDAFGCHTRKIRFEQLVEPLKIDLVQAVPIGLVLNEAITNAIKYAFGKNGGEIVVALQTIGNNNTATLTIKDNGKGLPKDFDIKLASSLGMEIMKALSRQLAGRFQIKSAAAGTTISIEFQLERVLSDNPSKSKFNTSLI